MQQILKSGFIYFLLTWFFASSLFAGENVSSNGESFAREYAILGSLLEKVQNKKTARLYRPQIEKELARLKSNQISGQEAFESLSPLEQKIFIKKYQNNHFHCGAVTKVMNERNRLLLNSWAHEELGSLLDELLQ